MDTALFDTPLPGSDASGFTFRAYDASNGLLVAGNASSLWVLKPDGTFVGRLVLPAPAMDVAVARGRVYVLSTDLTAYQIAPFSDAPAARSARLFSPSSSAQFAARVSVFRTRDGGTWVYAAGPTIGNFTNVFVFDESLNVRASSRLPHVDPGSITVAADSSGHPYLAYTGGPQGRLTVLDGLTLGQVRQPPPNLFPHGDPARLRFLQMDQPWTFAVPDGSPYVAERSIARADGPDVARLVFTSSDVYLCEIRVRVISAAPPADDRTVPTFRHHRLRFPPATVTMTDTRLALTGIDPRAGMRAACAPYLVSDPDGLTAFLFLAHAQPAATSCQAWRLPAPQPNSDWPSYWATEWQRQGGFAAQQPLTYVNTVGDDDWKLYRLACERLETGDTLHGSPGSLWMTG